MANISAGPESEVVKAAYSRHELQPPKVVMQPQKETVLAEMKACAIVHFAWHGKSNAVDPTTGGLFVGTASAVEHVSVAELMDLGPRKALLAVLSACSTAENADASLPDEGLSTANVFQIIGFPNVVSTLWEVNNLAAVEFNRIFYDRLLGIWKPLLPQLLTKHATLAHQSKGETITSTPEVLQEFSRAILRAMDHAVSEMISPSDLSARLRRKSTQDVLTWAPFIHLGM